jgi:pyrimidine-nucleoside phosphorylase
MNTVELIEKKKNNEPLSTEEIKFLVKNFTRGKIPDYQMSAFLMAVLLKGMNARETATLTDEMLNSGKVVDLSAIKGLKIDKHSTGGVGDKSSLIIAPIVASAGIYVPMISGRGLGHTGGTLDKLESISRFRTNISLTEYKKVLRQCGAVLIGQTKEIAPADKLMYSLRDVTATINSVPLITASIMSKKLAEGIDGLVLDIKTGNGAFMKSTKDALELSKSLIKTAKSFNKKVIAFITDMNQPLGNYVGNWLEVYESVKILKGQIKNDAYKLSTELAGAMLFLGNKTKSIIEGRRLAEQQIKTGKAFNKFLEIVEHQGGNTYFLNNPDEYPKSKHVKKVRCAKRGFIEKMDTYNIGMASMELGAGRKTKSDIIDHKAGIIFHKKTGDYVKNEEVICELHSNSTVKIKTAEQIIMESIQCSKTKPLIPKLIKKIIR